ncbi:DUF1156 domain-containing protein, partial [bacterium]|nr:DUF1156 domain-containing protein [bacterium]
MHKGEYLDLPDKRLIEHGFPCHQVGAETQRERGASSALPPLYFLHVWWARRPLTPSRAAIVASLAGEGTDPDLFLRQLGIERIQAMVNGETWTLTGEITDRIKRDGSGAEYLPVDEKTLRMLEAEEKCRAENRNLISSIKAKDPALSEDPVLVRWSEESRPIPMPWPKTGNQLPVKRVAGDPAWFKNLMIIGKNINIRIPNLYGYERSFVNSTVCDPTGITVLDPTAGGGSIPFEALRLGHTVIVNELNPVATTILFASIDYPIRFGQELCKDIEYWGGRLTNFLENNLTEFFPRTGLLAGNERKILENYLIICQECMKKFDNEEVTTYLFARQVKCPYCGGESPLLNTCWLSKEEKDLWGVRIIPDGSQRNGRVRFETYRVAGGKGPNGEDPNQATVADGEGICVHCKRPVPGDVIKAQARGESPHGKWKDRLYCVVAVRLEPKLDKNGEPVRYKSGAKKGEIQTRKIRFFRPPNEQDIKALEEAEKHLMERWPEWEAQGLIPTEAFPVGNDMRPVTYGMPRWCDMFTPRQLLGHLYLIEGLNRLKPEIIRQLGPDRGRAVVTYLQFAIDKGLDYNCRQTRWEYTRGIVKGAFSRHDFSLKWTFGEMIFTGPNSGAAWGLSQVIDAYQGIARLAEPLRERISRGEDLPLTIL